MKHWGKALFGVAVTVILLWWALREVSVVEVWTNIRDGNLWLLLASVAVATFGFFIRALRWKVLLAPLGVDTSVRSRFAGISIGFMANNTLPARMGEFIRAYSFSRMEPVTASAAFGTLVVERFLDGVVLLLFLVLTALSPGFPAADALSQGWGGAVLQAAVIAVVAVMVLLFAMAAFPENLVRLAEWTGRRLPERMAGPAVRGFETFLDAIAIMRDPKLLFLAFAWTVFFWAWHAVSFWLGMLAFGINTGFVSAVFVEAVVGFGVAIPAAPGFIGTFHASAKFALSDVYGVADPDALAFAFGYHFGGWIPITAIGLWYAWKLGLSVGDVGTAQEQVGKE
ncbi:MAG: flippase-like domain-containing protein [Gemmatimonadota bacterium]|nr:flippase-like domain-containing protein [Gemmatimonadota bacterium]MDH3422719.1 flippase-like domain-containing protein [Gemmatimonadota bacterium]